MFDRLLQTRLPKTIALALVLGVFVPSTCIIWFMNEAIQNERFAARQKIIDVYHQQLIGINKLWQSHWLGKISSLNGLSKNNNVNKKQSDKLMFLGIIENNLASSSVIFNNEKLLSYPSNHPSSDFTNQYVISSAAYKKASQLEFIEGDFVAAGEIYKSITVNESNNTLVARAYQAWVRCLLKLNDHKQALAVLTGDMLSPKLVNTRSRQGRLIVANTLLQAWQLIKKHSPEQQEKILVQQELITLVNSYTNELGANQRLFLMNKLTELKTFFPTITAETIAYKYISQHLNSLSDQESINTFSNNELLLETEVDNIWQLSLSKNNITALFTLNFLQTELNNIYPEDNGIKIKLLPPNSIDINENNETILFDKLLMGDLMPGWQITLSVDSTLLLNENVDENIATYLWVGLLLVLSIILLSIFTMRYVLVQQRLHSLKNDLMSTVTHELKTPLSSIRLFVEILLNEKTEHSTKTIEYLTLIDNENRRLTRLIENFLSFSRMENKKQVFKFLPVRTEHIVDVVLSAVEERFRVNGFTFLTHIQEDLPIITVDEGLLVVAINNLLDNAYKYSLNNKEITFSVYCKDNYLYFEITDQGVGLSKSECKRIYDGFYRVNQKLTQVIDGCGLGLSITKYIVEHHQGEILIQSELGQGSTFLIKLAVIHNIIDNDVSSEQ